MAKYSYITDKTHSDRKIQVESAVRDGDGKNIVNNYSKQNGYYANMGVGQADELSTTRQIENPETACPPITMGITGGNAEIKTGIEKFEYLEGNSFAFNQLVRNGNFSSNSEWVALPPATLTIANNKATFTSTSVSDRLRQTSFKTIENHVYYIKGKFNSNTVGNLSVEFSRGWVKTNLAITNANQDVVLKATLKPTSSSDNNEFFQVYLGTSTYQLIVYYLCVFDLTAMFGAGNEPTTEQFDALFPCDYYAYNAGSILSAKVNSLISRGRQQWDEQWEVGSIDGSTGQKTVDNNKIRSKSYISVVNNQDYYFKCPVACVLYYYDINKNYIGFNSILGNETFTTPANASYLMFRLVNDYGTTYQNDITISIYFDDGEDYDEHYAYSQDVVALPNIELRAIGDIKDIAYASGGGKRKLGYVNLGASDNGISFSYNSTYGYFQINLTNLANLKDVSKPKVLLARYDEVSMSQIAQKSDAPDKSYAVGYTGNWNDWLMIKDTSAGTDASAFKSSLDGVYLLYELATETELTENTGWDESINVNNYGTLEFTTSPQQIPQVKQPYFIEYTISLKEFLDSTYVNAGGDASDIVYEEELTQFQTNLENGTIVVAKAEVSDNLTPYDDESGEEQTQPFALQGTGCGNGETQVDTGSFAQLKEKQGNSVVVNQGFISSQATTTINDITFTNNGDGSWTANGTASADTRYDFAVPTGKDFPLFAGHKFLVYSIADVRTDGVTALSDLNGRLSPANTGGFSIATNNATSGNFRPYFRVPNTKTVNNVKIRPIIVDLTKMFGSNDNIPAYLLAHPESFFNYYQGSLTYNTGTLVNSNATNLKCIGRNVWDESAEGGKYNSQGEKESVSNEIRNVSPIKVIPNTTYHFYKPVGVSIAIHFRDVNNNFIGGVSLTDNKFTTPENCLYVNFYTSNYGGATYNNNITISIYYDGESGYDQYYPYEVLSNIDTGNEVLRSAGSVKDYKTPDGTIHRLVGVVDLGSLTWTYSSTWGYFISTETLNDISTDTPIYNIICGKYMIAVGNLSSLDKVISTNNSYYSVQKKVIVKDSSYGTDAAAFKSAMSGIYLYYELAEETTEQGTAFSENVNIDDFGSMMWTADDFNGVPQGCKIFYPVDYKAFVDTLTNVLDGDASSVLHTGMSQSDLDTFLNNKGYYRQIDYSSEITNLILTVTDGIAKAYRIGNVVYLTIRAKNTSGSQINADTIIANLGTHLRWSLGGFAINGAISNQESAMFSLEYNGNIMARTSIPSNAWITIIVSYAVA